ncbi:MAG: hypothetical protein M3076_15225 [Actinomycetota bacterium]|nr:hypothetical protein [Actinomycetota bacterium]
MSAPFGGSVTTFGGNHQLLARRGRTLNVLYGPVNRPDLDGDWDGTALTRSS